MKRAKRNVWYAMAGILIFLGLGVPVQATEVTMTLQKTTKDVEVKESPDQNSNTVSELPAGTGVIVYGEPKNSWSQIEYASVNGYIESSALKPYLAGSVEELEQEFEEVQEDTLQAIDEYETEQQSEQAEAIDEGSDTESSALETYAQDDSTEELDQEFEEVQEEMLRAVEEYEMEQKSKRTATLWGVVIAVLVVAIFAVGIVSALKKDKEEEKEEDKKEEKEEQE